MDDVREKTKQFEIHQGKYAFFVHQDFYDPIYKLLESWENAFAQAANIDPEHLSWFTTENNFGTNSLQLQKEEPQCDEFLITDSESFWDFEMGVA